MGLAARAEGRRSDSTSGTHAAVGGADGWRRRERWDERTARTARRTRGHRLGTVRGPLPRVRTSPTPRSRNSGLDVFRLACEVNHLSPRHTGAREIAASRSRVSFRPPCRSARGARRSRRARRGPARRSHPRRRSTARARAPSRRRGRPGAALHPGRERARRAPACSTSIRAAPSTSVRKRCGPRPAVPRLDRRPDRPRGLPLATALHARCQRTARRHRPGARSGAPPSRRRTRPAWAAPTAAGSRTGTSPAASRPTTPRTWSSAPTPRGSTSTIPTGPCSGLATAGLPPAKVVSGEASHAGQALDALLGDGAVIRGGSVIRSVVGRSVLVEVGAEIEDSLLLDGCRVGRCARVRRAVVAPAPSSATARRSDTTVRR